MVLTCSWPHISLEMNKLIFSNSKTLPKLTKMLCPFFSKIAVTYCEKMWIGLWLRKFFANLRLKAKAELLRSLEQFIRTVKCQNKFWSRMLFKLFARSDFGMQTGTSQKWCIVTKIVLTYCEKKLFQWSKIISRSLEQFAQTVKKSEQFLVTECFFNLFLEVSHI